MKRLDFIVPDNNTFYQIELSKTLLHFCEYDFTYFWEQAIDFGSSSRRDGHFDKKQATVLKNLIIKCHPYYEAKLNTDFSDIVLDCIIEYFCRTENIGLEGLWTKYISPSDAFEKAVFTRISEYKTNKATNQWVNLVRLQKYLKTKISFIFDGQPCSVAEYMSKCRYFDLAFSVAAKEIGFPDEFLPSVKEIPLTQIPGAPFMISRASKDIYKHISDKTENAPPFTKKHIEDYQRDCYALDAFEYIKSLEMPPQFEMQSAIEAFRYLPKTVYMPNCFKAMLDFEIEKMLDEAIVLSKCSNCGKYFVREPDYNGTYCNRVGKSGKTCREELETVTDDYISSDLDKKSNKIYESLYDKIGTKLPETEFNEWSEYLTRLKENVKSHNASQEDLESFLNYTEKMYGDIQNEPTH